MLAGRRRAAQRAGQRAAGRLHRGRPACAAPPPRPGIALKDYIAARAKEVPLGRIGRAEEFANIACFLASDAGSYITGTAINVDGGRSPGGLGASRRRAGPDRCRPPSRSISAASTAQTQERTSQRHRRMSHKCHRRLSAGPHSITSSAMASSVKGTSRSSAFAAFRLMTSSNVVGR